MTPKELCTMIQKGENDRLEAILKQTPEVFRAKTEQGISLLQFAVYCRNARAVELLRPTKTNIDIYEAGSLGDLATVELRLLLNPGLIDTYSPDGYTPLCLAVYFGHYDVARYLLTQGADPDKISKNAMKIAPLHSAVTICNFELMELLLEHGADANVREQGGYSPLDVAAICGKTKIAELLLQHGADVNAKMPDGKTPLQLAEEKGFSATSDLIRKYV